MNKIGNEYTILGQASSTSSDNVIETEDLSQFKYIGVVSINSDGQWTNPSFIPLEIFKGLNSPLKPLASGFTNLGGDRFACAWYINNTKIGLYTANSYDIAKVYGIK